MSIGSEKIIRLKKARQKKIRKSESQKTEKKQKIKEKLKAKIKMDRKSISGTILELLVNKFGIDKTIKKLNRIVKRKISLSLFIDLLFSKKLKRNNNCKIWHHLNQNNLIFFKEHMKRLEIIDKQTENILLTRSLKELKNSGFIEYKIKNHGIGFFIKIENI